MFRTQTPSSRTTAYLGLVFSVNISDGSFRRRKATMTQLLEYTKARQPTVKANSSIKHITTNWGHALSQSTLNRPMETFPKDH